jgi:hypothetical protein
VVHGGFGVGGVGEVVGEGVRGEEDDVEDRVGALGGFGGRGEGFLGALVASVGEEDEDFAASLRGELVVGGEVDGVVEEGAAGVGGGEGASADAGGSGGGARRIDRSRVDGAGEFGEAVGVVGEEVDVDVEGDEEGDVFRGEDVFEEARGGLLLEEEDALLAAAGVEEEADGEREVFLLGEGLDGLGLMVVEDAAVGGGEVEDVAGGVADGEVGVDEAGGEVEGLGGEGGGGCERGCFAGGGWGVRRGGFLGAEGGGGEEEGEDRRGEETHGAIRVADFGRPARDLVGLRRKAIWSLRLRLHSGLRQQGWRLRHGFFMARLKPCPFEGSAGMTRIGAWWGERGGYCRLAQRSGGLVRLKGIGDCDEEEAMVGAVGPPRW